jgi:hypothetical protein
VLRYLEDHLSAHWGILGRTQIKDDTLALLALREKAHRAATGASCQGTTGRAGHGGACAHAGEPVWVRTRDERAL